MKVRKILGVSILTAVASSGAAVTSAPVFASSAHQTYGPTAKPPTKVSAPGKVIAVVPKTGGGGTAAFLAPGVPARAAHAVGKSSAAASSPAPAAQVQTLPRTGGGAAPMSPDNSVLPLLAAAGLTILGFGVRRRFR